MINELKKEILNGDETNVCYSENGAKMNATTGKHLLDLSFKIPQMRGIHNIKTKLNRSLIASYYENPEMFIRFLFYMRDVRGGLGERDTFRQVFDWLCTSHPDIAAGVIGLIPEYGRWDDLVYIALNTSNKDIQRKAVEIIVEQIKADKDSENVSLLGKWLPSVNAGNASKAEAKKLIKLINGVCNTTMNEAYYRKTVAGLRKKAEVVERDIAAKNYANINYEHVPSLANTRYSNLFMRYDEARRTAYLQSLSKGEKKINSSAAFPHDIWKMCARTNDSTADEMWKALPDYVNGDSRVLVIRDGSGSMTITIPGSNTTALDVASALCVYFAERLSGEFKDKFITFSSTPELVELPENSTLNDKYRFLYGYNDCTNTNLKATFDLIRRTAISHNLKQDELPNTLLIVSDMEFDDATYTDYWNRGPAVNKKLFNTIEQEWKQSGYKMPKLVFWNVNSRTSGIPVTENELGVILVSGFSAAISKMVLSNQTDPYLALTEQLMVERYDQVIEPIKDLLGC